jgi:hypothetical protein
VKFDLKSIAEANKAFEYLTELVGKEALAEVKKISPARSIKQNAYLHLTFSIFGMELGYEASEAKVIYKRLANPELYIYEKNNQTFLKSSRDLSTKEMSDSIDKWRKYASEQGVDIPAPENQEALMYWENQIETMGKYL